MDQGLIQGLAEGLKSGITAYREEADRKYKRELDQKKLLKDEEDRQEKLGLLREQRELEKMKIGLKKDEQGNWVTDPESLAYKKLAVDEAKSEAFLRATLSKEQQAEYDRLINQRKLDLLEKKQGADTDYKQKYLGLLGERQRADAEQKSLDAQIKADTEKARQGLITAQTETEKARPGLMAAQAEKAKAEAKRKSTPSAPKPPKLTGDQFKAAGFAKRLEQAEQVFSDLESRGFDRASAKQGLLSLLPDQLQSDEIKQQNQAERNFINAVLRRESGASISPTEFKSAEKQYFSRQGDSDQVKAQKRANREQVMASLRAEAQGAYEQVPTVNVPKAPAKKAGPPVGTIKNGYKFKGGDPNEQKNWEKVK